MHGVVLHGSAVHGGLRRDSDLDLLVVCRRRLTRVERRSIVDGLLVGSRSSARPDLPRHLEVTIVVDEDVRPWTYPPRLELQYGDWWRWAFEAGQDAPWHSPDPDLAIVLSAARATGRSLVGPDPRVLLEPVPRADLEHALTAIVPAVHADLVDDTRNVLLTLARIVLTLETGAIESKDVAADHVAHGLSAGPAATMQLARDAYRGLVEDRWDDVAARAEAAAAADALLARIDELSGSAARARDRRSDLSGGR